ncbi:MAG: ankyrin repeat domain-containing protein [Pirellulaceae bacterium]|nr:ankyrin repeat domain-containing protein [Pirellulaceae bacterium]
MARPRTLKSASEAGDLDAVKYHLSQGADVNATTAAGHFALGAAVINGHSEVVEYLIAQGADIGLLSEFGWSPLYMAAWRGQTEIVAQLLAAGARTNTQTLDGWHSPAGYTPLHIAAVQGHLAIVMLLIAAGARASTTDDDKQTALDLAVEGGHAAVAKFLRRARKPSNTGRRILSLPRPRRAAATDL